MDVTSNNTEQPIAEANEAQDKPNEEGAEKQANGDKNEGEQKPTDEKKKKKPPRTITIEFPIVENVPFMLNIDECILAEVCFLKFNILNWVIFFSKKCKPKILK